MKQDLERKKNCFLLPAAVYLILKKEDQILLIRRNKTGYADGLYSLVAGCIDGDESVTQAMIREAKEEAGITLKSEWLKLSLVMHRRKTLEQNWESVLFFFVAKHWEGELINAEPHKHDDLRFFPLDGLPDNLIPYVRVAIDEVAKGNHFIEYGW